MTQENGSKSYGVCVITYDKPDPTISSQLESMINEWRTNYVVSILFLGMFFDWLLIVLTIEDGKRF